MVERMDRTMAKGRRRLHLDHNWNTLVWALFCKLKLKIANCKAKIKAPSPGNVRRVFHAVTPILQAGPALTEPQMHAALASEIHVPSGDAHTAEVEQLHLGQRLGCGPVHTVVVRESHEAWPEECPGHLPVPRVRGRGTPESSLARRWLWDFRQGKMHRQCMLDVEYHIFF